MQVFHDCENHLFPQTPSSSIKPSPSGPNRQVPKSLHSLSGANHRKTQGKGRKNEVKAAGAHVRSSSSSSSCLIHTSAFLHAGAIPSALSRKLATGRGSSSHTGGVLHESVLRVSPSCSRTPQAAAAAVNNLHKHVARDNSQTAAHLMLIRKHRLPDSE